MWTGGVRMIPIKTPKGTFNVWTKRVGNNPAVKLLLLHGGPAATHEYFEAFDSFLPAAGVEYYYYDQLGSFYSDHPDDDSLYELPRFVEEVEQVRQVLGLHRDNFYLLGHSWGGILGHQYALAYQQHLKGLVISNMMSSIPAYVEYANTVLMPPAMDQQVLAEVKALEAKKDYNPRYMELLMPAHYDTVLSGDPRPSGPIRSTARSRISTTRSTSPCRVRANSARPANWRNGTAARTSRRIAVPTLVIGAEHDSMDPKHMEWMSQQLPKGEYLHCPNGSHMDMSATTRKRA